MNYLIVVYLTSFLILNLALLGSTSEHRIIAHVLSVVPFFNTILALGGLVDLTKRAQVSKGRCILGHNMKVIYDSEVTRNDHRSKGFPIPCSIGGYERHECNRCRQEETVKWRAF